MARWLGQRVYYGWIVVAVTALTLIVSAGVRSAPAVFILPMEHDTGWSRAAIAVAVATGLLLFGLAGPPAGRLMDRFGPRPIMLLGLGLAGLSMVISAAITDLWQLYLFWGMLSGVGTGLAAAVLGAAVANRWFVARRGLVLGIFGGATSGGQLVFIPLLMSLVLSVQWRQATLLLGLIVLVVLAPVLLLMRDDPRDVGLEPYGGPPPAPVARVAPGSGVMRTALRTPEFWLLAGSFFVCGATSNGLIGTHFIPHSVDHGIPAVTAAGALALMGAMNFVGTVGSGWLTDRIDPRKLLAFYYTFRGLSLVLLPFITFEAGLTFFAILFGLDYIATVPPTVALTADTFGRRHVATVFGWVFLSHQVGAALAASLGGVAKEVFGDYMLAFVVAGILAVMGGLMALMINRRAAQLAPATGD
jgi:sugar phosphate permease